MTDSSRNSGAWSTTPYDYLASRKASYSAEHLRRSCYLTMRDGVRIATDIFVPAEAGWETPLPTIAVFTPYYRRFELTSQGRWKPKKAPTPAIFAISLLSMAMGS